MTSGADAKTSTTLLRRLRQDPTDPSAWNEFVERYGRMIYRWCRRITCKRRRAGDAERITDTGRPEERTTIQPGVSLFKRSLPDWCQQAKKAGWGGAGPNHYVCGGGPISSTCWSESAIELLETGLVAARAAPYLGVSPAGT